LAVAAACSAAVAGACVDDAPQVPAAPPDASFDVALRDVAKLENDGASESSADASVDALDPLCDLVAVRPDTGDAGVDAYIGDGAIPDVSVPDAAPDASVTYVVKCSVPVKQVSSQAPYGAPGSACALAQNGDLYCWGANFEGTLGGVPYAPDAGGVNYRSRPTKVLDDVKQVSAGTYSTCAVKNDGSVWCWGANTLGQLGFDPNASPDHCVGNDFCAISPHQLTLAPPLDAGAADGGAAKDAGPTVLPKFDKVVAGEWLTCASASVTGELWCWGAVNAYGPDGWRPRPFDGIPAPVRDVSSSGHFGTSICAIGADTFAYCWGFDVRGKLGYLPPGGFQQAIHKVDVDALGAPFDKLKQISVGRFTACALKTDQTAWCWGSNGYAELGQGTWDSLNHPAPSKVLGLPPDVVKIDVNTYYAPFALTATGEVLGWGNIENFSFGDGLLPITTCEGALVCQPRPRRVAGLPVMTDIQYLFGLDVNGGVWAWGDNSWGWLGHEPGTSGDSFCSGSSGRPCRTVAQRLPVYP
jgi:hypothetical protein